MILGHMIFAHDVVVLGHGIMVLDFLGLRHTPFTFLAMVFLYIVHKSYNIK